MKIQVKLFASVRRVVGKGEVFVNINNMKTAGEVLELMIKKYPELEELKETIMISLNHKLAEKSTPVSRGDEMALFPPVSGG